MLKKPVISFGDSIILEIVDGSLYPQTLARRIYSSKLPLERP